MADLSDHGMDNVWQWTEAGAVRLCTAADQLADAIATHSRAVAGATGAADLAQVRAAGERLVPAIRAYAAAHVDYTGAHLPLDTSPDTGNEERTAADPTPGEPSVTAITVLQRRDFTVTDPQAVLAAGDAAYRRRWPRSASANQTEAGGGDGEAGGGEAGEAGVCHLVHALHLLADEAGGWDDLDGTLGVAPTGAALTALPQPAPLRGDPADWPADLFAVNGTPLYQEEIVYHTG